MMGFLRVNYGWIVLKKNARRIKPRAIFYYYLAEAEGFEPSHAGIKIQCLNQLGDASIETEIIARGSNYCKHFEVKVCDLCRNYEKCCARATLL